MRYALVVVASLVKNAPPVTNALNLNPRDVLLAPARLLVVAMNFVQTATIALYVLAV